MGNQSTQQTPQVLEILQHRHLGQLHKISHNGQPCCFKQYHFVDQYSMQDLHRKMKNRIHKYNNNKHVLNIYHAEPKLIQDLCINSYQLVVVLELPAHPLSQVIDSKIANRLNFSEEELCKYLEAITESLIYMQNSGLKNIYLDSQTILVSLIGGKIESAKILDTSLTRSNSYLELLQELEGQNDFSKNTRSRSLYLAPELLKDLKEINYDPYISTKADIFTLGMIFLEMICLEPMTGYFDYCKYTIDYDSLIHRISKINYSLPMKTLLAQMLESDPQERIGLVSLLEKVKAFFKSEREGMSCRSKSSKMLKDLMSSSRRSTSNKKNSTQISNSASRLKIRSELAQQDSIKCMDKTQITALQQLKNCSKLNEEKNMYQIAQKDVVDIDSQHLKKLLKQKISKQKQISNENSSQLSEPLRKPYENLQNLKPPLVSQVMQKDFSKNILPLETSFSKMKASYLEENQIKNKGSIEFASKIQKAQSFIHQSNKLVKAKLQQLPTKLSYHQHAASSASLFAAEEAQNKMITFKNNELFFNPKSFNVEQHESPNKYEKVEQIFSNQYEKLTFSPIQTEFENCSEHEESQEKIIDSFKMSDIPVVYSQEKSERETHQKEFLNNSINSRLRQNQFQSKMKFGFAQKEIPGIIQVSQSKQSSRKYENKQINYFHKDKETFFDSQNKIKETGFHKKRHLNLQLDLDEASEQPQKNARKKYLLGNDDVKSKLDGMYCTTKSIDNYLAPNPHDLSQESIVLQNVTKRDESNFQEQISASFEQEHEEQTERIFKKVILPSKEIYEGEFSKDQLINGNGTLYTAQNIVKYSGSWKNGIFDGFGTQYNLKFSPTEIVDCRNLQLQKNNWIKYEGQFFEGSKNGFGTLYFSEEKFSGCFKFNNIEGYGCFHKKNGKMVSGLWNQNILTKL